MSWELAWREGRTGWDAGQSPPELRRLLRRGELPKGRTLVPGCGAGYDVLALAADPQRSVVGIDISPTAVRRFDELRAASDIEPHRARVEVGDFFTIEDLGTFDLIWDYTFLCAIDPSSRERWKDVVLRALAPAGELVTLLFPATEEPPFGEGPPHAIPPQAVSALLSPELECVELRPVERSHPGRRGMEQLARWRRT